ncbi:hypothetical protein ABZ816_07675 [Actinosynnema sp. NPDC047251]|uniref:hypothetical protein n=1 Tax=Saccharothrix espanaensis TaxID=103731 RepID=UPI00059E2438|nr:hypothetical protein [Saccharothrix espanaensis]
MGQLSFFSAEARRPCVADLAGLLCGPGRAVGFARGRAARISVCLDERWRGVALVAALAERGVQARLELVRRPAPVLGQAPPDDAPDEAAPGGTPPAEADVADGRPSAPAEPPRAVGGGLEVTTAYRTDLTGLAHQWLVGDTKVVPPEFTPHGGVLRLWALASGRWAESAYVLGLDPESPDTHEPLQKALAASGLPATLLKTGGPALRVVGRRRLERLAELVGRAPRGVVERTWPAA